MSPSSLIKVVCFPTSLTFQLSKKCLHTRLIVHIRYFRVTETLPLLALSMTLVEFGQNCVRCNTLTLRLHFIELKEYAKSYVNFADTGFRQVIFKEIKNLIKNYQTNKQTGRKTFLLMFIPSSSLVG